MNILSFQPKRIAVTLIVLISFFGLANAKQASADIIPAVQNTVNSVPGTVNSIPSQITIPTPELTNDDIINLDGTTVSINNPSTIPTNNPNSDSNITRSSATDANLAFIIPVPSPFNQIVSEVNVPTPSFSLPHPHPTGEYYDYGNNGTFSPKTTRTLYATAGLLGLIGLAISSNIFGNFKTGIFSSPKLIENPDRN